MKEYRLLPLDLYLKTYIFWNLLQSISYSELIFAMDDEFDRMGKVIKDAGAKGFNPGLIVLLVVGGLLLTFLIGNYVLYMYAQKNLPPRKKKPVSKKKMKKEKLKQGISAPGE
ncbi:hypothetical protein ACOSP7_029628 [Xanthoceras sorbifolium]